MKKNYHFTWSWTVYVLLATGLIVGSTHFSFATQTYDERDLAVLADIIALNNFNVPPLKLGNQIWRDGRLISLSIRLGESKIRHLPESIGQLSELQELDLSYNKLEQIPDSIGSLAKLTTLYLHGNNIRQVPETIGYLEVLRELRLNNNQIHLLPLTLGQLQQLRNLYINNNPLSGIPDCVITLPNLDNLYY